MERCRKSRKNEVLSKATLPIHEEFTYVTELQVGLLTYAFTPKTTGMSSPPKPSHAFTQWRNAGKEKIQRLSQWRDRAGVSPASLFSRYRRTGNRHLKPKL
jgi:hypothetical protein